MDANAIAVRVDDRNKTLRFSETLVAGSVYAVAVEGGADVCGETAVLAMKIGRTTVAWAALTDGAGELSLLTQEMCDALDNVREGARVPALAVLRCTDEGRDLVIAMGKADVLYAGSEWFQTTELNRVIATGAEGPPGPASLLNYIRDDDGRYWRIKAEVNDAGESTVVLADEPEPERPLDPAASAELLQAANEAVAAAAESAAAAAASAQSAAESATAAGRAVNVDLSGSVTAAAESATAAGESATAAATSATTAAASAAAATAAAEQAANSAAQVAGVSAADVATAVEQALENFKAQYLAGIVASAYKNKQLQITTNNQWTTDTRKSGNTYTPDAALFKGLVPGGTYLLSLTVAPVGTSSLLIRFGATHGTMAGDYTYSVTANTGLKRWQWSTTADENGVIHVWARASNRTAVAAEGRLYFEAQLTGLAVSG